MGKNLLFSLDIGTRSVVGIVGEQIGNNIKIISAERKEHHTRAMLDGQIHDVPEVAAVLGHVKNELEKKSRCSLFMVSACFYSFMSTLMPDLNSTVKCFGNTVILSISL